MNKILGINAACFEQCPVLIKSIGDTEPGRFAVKREDGKPGVIGKTESAFTDKRNRTGGMKHESGNTWPA